jgi:DNA-binding transcriptional LysR family regulator
LHDRGDKYLDTHRPSNTNQEHPKMMGINPVRFRHFRAVLDQGSIRKAAEHLGTAPSVIVRQIRHLETDVGALLFVRGTHGTKPTSAAQHLLEFWSDYQSLQKKLEDNLHRLLDLHESSIRMSISEGVLPSLMNDVLAGFSKRFPKIEVVVNIKATNDILKDILENEADIGIAYNPPAAADLKYLASARHHVVLAVSPVHPLANRKNPLSLRESLAYPCGLMPPAYGLGQFARAIARIENARLAPALTVNTLTALKEFAKSANGVSFLTDYAIADDVAIGKLVALRINHSLSGQQYVRLVINENRPLARPTQELIKWIKACMSVFTGTSPEAHEWAASERGAAQAGAVTD